MRRVRRPGTGRWAGRIHRPARRGRARPPPPGPPASLSGAASLELLQYRTAAYGRRAATAAARARGKGGKKPGDGPTTAAGYAVTTRRSRRAARYRGPRALVLP